MYTSPESCDHLRQAIDHEIHSLEESARTLKSRQNELVSISRLAPGTLAAIFFSLSLSTWNDETDEDAWYNQTGNMTWIRVAHVCRLWRETALNHPRIWSHINLTKLTPVGMAQILARVRKLPLYMKADVSKWSAEQIAAFAKQLESHISHTRHLSISGEHLPALLEQLVSPAPILKVLSLSPKSPQSLLPLANIPDNLFNRTTPSLTNLELESCDIIWMSPFLKGLRSLQMIKLSIDARPKLEDWLDALSEMPQLEELSLQSATPLAPLTGPLIPKPSRSTTLPSLTRFYISDSSKECVLAVAHLVLPALTRLHVDVESQDWSGEDVRLVIPYVARIVCGIHSIEPLRSILFSGEGKRAEVVAWTTPDADVEVRNSTTVLRESVSARLMFTATGMHWNHEVVTATYDALFSLLHVDPVSTFSALNHTRLSKEFWLNQAPRLPLLERVCLVPTAVKAFRDMLAEDAPSDGPRLPSLTKITIFCVTWTSTKTYHFRDMLIERVEQGVPLESLVLSGCEEPFPRRANQIFAEIAVDVQGPLYSSWKMDEEYVRTGSRKEVEYDDDWDSEPWYGLDSREVEYVYDDYVGPFDGVDFNNIRVEYDPEDGLPFSW
jgi:F-box-like